MRSLAVALLALSACADPAPDLACPADEATLVAGAACTTAPTETCLHHGSGYCGAAWDGLYRCTCTGGHWACDDVYPTDGAACDWPAGSACAREGNPDCATMPTAGYCTCAAGTWTCDDACWHECPQHWDARWSTQPPACSTSGQRCDLPGGHTCACDGARFTCQ